MGRSELIAFCLVIVGVASSAVAATSSLSPGDTLGGHIRVLNPSECSDLSYSPTPDVTAIAALANSSGTVTQPPSQIPPQQLSTTGIPVELLKFDPDGSAKRIRSDDCTGDHLQSLIFANPDVGAQSAAISNFFKTCQTTIKRQGSSDLLALLQIYSVTYNACDNPRIHAVEVTLDDGTKLRGLLGLQDSTRPLPMLIFKEGAFGNSSSTSSRMNMMAMFDQAPMNMLVLGNITGSDFLRDNQHIALGGFDEGMQVVKVAKLLRQSELSSRISEINMMGISLGGQAALFAGYYNSWPANYYNGAPLISSLFAQSPVVNLESSMNSLFAPGLKMSVLRRLLLGDFLKVLANLPFLSQTLQALEAVTKNPSAMPAIIAEGSIEYYSKVSSDWGLPPTEGVISSVPELWTRNDFLTMPSSALTTQTMVMGANVDWIVDPVDNSLALKAKLNHDGNKSAVKVVTLDRGNHCAFGPALGWDIYSALMISYEISHSPSLMARRHFETQPIALAYLKNYAPLKSDEKTVDYRFSFSPKNNYAQITIDQTDDKKKYTELCGLVAPELLVATCLKQSVVQIPLNALPSWARQPVNDADAQALTRWVNTNVRLVSADGTAIGLNNKNPSAFKWVSYE